MNIQKMNEYIKRLYDVSDVKMGFDYWYFKLFNILLNIFEYENVPEGLSQRELELNLLMTGHAVVLPKRDGSLFTPLTSLFGYDEYYQPTMAVFANPVVISAKEYKIGVECEVIYNNKLKDGLYYIHADSGLATFVSRYARQLADVESTINIYTVNSRLTSYPVTTDGSVTESLKAFFKNLVMGKRAIITDDAIIEKFRNVDINRAAIRDGVNEWLIARDKILEQFYRDLGVQMYNPKKAQVTDDEVESNTQLLLISTDDMLRERKEGLDRVNNMYGTSIDVRINPLFKTTTFMGGDSNET